MYVVVFGLRNAGLTDVLARVIEASAEQGLFFATIAMGFIAAILSSIMNNMPTVMIDAIAIADTDTTGVIREALVRSEEHTSELQSRGHLVCRLLLEKKKKCSIRSIARKTK